MRLDRADGIANAARTVALSTVHGGEVLTEARIINIIHIIRFS